MMVDKVFKVQAGNLVTATMGSVAIRMHATRAVMTAKFHGSRF